MASLQRRLIRLKSAGRSNLWGFVSCRAQAGQCCVSPQRAPSHHRFLNRLLGCRLEDQAFIFSYFAAALDKVGRLGWNKRGQPAGPLSGGSEAQSGGAGIVQGAGAYPCEACSQPLLLSLCTPHPGHCWLQGNGGVRCRWAEGSVSQKKPVGTCRALLAACTWQPDALPVIGLFALLRRRHCDPQGHQLRGGAQVGCAGGRLRCLFRLLRGLS